jgi:hypothetical protein
MNSIFNKATSNALINRVNLLNENSIALWGKMNVYQMVKHCILCDEMYLGKVVYKRHLFGFLFGKMKLHQLLKDDKPKEHNSPTKSNFKNLQANSNLEQDKATWIKLINEYEHFTNTNFVHWFYGKMTKDQVGISVYKHIDHHLRQFNC